MAVVTAEELRALRWRTAQTLRASAEHARSERLRGQDGRKQLLLDKTEPLKRHDRWGVPLWTEGGTDG